MPLRMQTSGAHSDSNQWGRPLLLHNTETAKGLHVNKKAESFCYKYIMKWFAEIRRQKTLGRLEFFLIWIMLSAFQMLLFAIPIIGVPAVLPISVAFVWIFAKRFRLIGLPGGLALIPIGVLLGYCFFTLWYSASVYIGASRPFDMTAGEFQDLWGPIMFGLIAFIVFVGLVPAVEHDGQ